MLPPKALVQLHPKDRANYRIHELFMSRSNSVCVGLRADVEEARLGISGEEINIRFDW